MHSGPTTRAKAKIDPNRRLADVLLGKSNEPLEVVLKDKPDLDKPITAEGLPALALAVHRDHRQHVKQLLAHGAENKPFLWRNTEYRSCDYFGPGSRRTLSLLITRGKPLPLHKAVGEQCYEEASSLLAKGADPNARYNGEYPLIIALQNNDNRMIELLLKSGADINALFDNHRTMQYILTASENQYDTIMTLLEKQEIELIPSALNLLGKINKHFKKCKDDDKLPIILLGETHLHQLTLSFEKIMLSYLTAMEKNIQFCYELPSDSTLILKTIYTKFIGLNSVSFTCIDHPIARTAIPSRNRDDYMQTRDSRMAEKMCQFTQPVVAIVGAAHLKGLTEKIDHKKFSVLPINLTTLFNSNMPVTKHKFQDIVRFSETADDFKFFLQNKKVVQCEHVTHTNVSKKRQRDNEENQDIALEVLKRANTSVTSYTPLSQHYNQIRTIVPAYFGLQEIVSPVANTLDKLKKRFWGN